MSFPIFMKQACGSLLPTRYPAFMVRLIGAGSGMRAFEQHRADRNLTAVVPAGFGVQQGGQPDACLLIIITPSAHIADPGREIRHADQFIAQPGEVGDVFQVHDTC